MKKCWIGDAMNEGKRAYCLIILNMPQTELFPDSPREWPSLVSFVWNQYIPSDSRYRFFDVSSWSNDFHPDTFQWRIVHLRRSDIVQDSWNYIVTIGWHNYLLDEKLVRLIKGDSIIIFHTLDEVIAIWSSSVESVQDSVVFDVYKITRWSFGRAQVELEIQNLDHTHARHLTDRLNSLDLENTLYVFARKVSGLISENIIMDLIEIAPPPSASHIPHIRERYPGIYWLSFHDPVDKLVVIDDDSCLENLNIQFAY